MEDCLGGPDCSETSLKRDFPVILAALRKPAESSYRSGDFSNHLCFIPQYWCTMSETFSPRSSPVGERACSSGRLCEEKVLLEVAQDEESFSSARKTQIFKRTHEVAEECGAERSLKTTAAHEQFTKASFDKCTTPTGAVSGTGLLEASEKQTIEKGGGSGNEVVQPSSDAAVQPLGSSPVTNQNKAKTIQDTAPYSHDGSKQERLDDYIPCLFYRWPLSDTLILHFHGMDEDLGKTAAFLQRLHQHLKVNILAMEYPGYGICSELPRDSAEGSNESLRDSRTTRSRSHSFPSSPNYSGPSASETHQQAALSRRHHHQTNSYSPQRAREQQAEEPEVCVRSEYCGRNSSSSKEKPPVVRNNSRMVNDGHASKESFKDTNSSQAAHHRQIAASFKTLLIFVLKRLEVPPQCIFLSAVKLAAGLVLELCQFADQANISLGGLVLLQPLFIFPFSPPRTGGLTPVEPRGHVTSPTEPVCGSEARNACEVHRLSFHSKRTQNGAKNVFLPPSRPENLGVKETENIKTTPPGDVRGWPVQDRLESLEDIRSNHSFYRLQAKSQSREDVAELCTSSSNTTAELLQGGNEESDFCKARAQGDPGAAEETASSFRRKRESEASHSPVQCPATNLKKCSPLSEAVNISNHRYDFVPNAEEDSKSRNCSSRAGGLCVTSADSLESDYRRIAAEIADASDTEGQQTETVSSVCSASLDRVQNTSLDGELGFSTPAKSLFEQVRGFLLPSFAPVPDDELEEGGKAAAIAEAALQLGRRRKLERRRHLAAALEDAFGMKQAVQRMSAVKCPILFVAHCAVQTSRPRGARKVRVCRNRTVSRGEDIATDSSSTTSSSSDSVASTPVSDSDVLGTLHRMFGGGDSLLSRHTTARKPNANESVSTDMGSFCMRAQPTKREEERTSGLQSPNGCALDIQQTAFPGNIEKLRSIDEKQERSRLSSGNRQISFDHESASTCQVIPERSRLRCSRRGGEENVGSANDRLTEDAIVDRSIGLLMAHGNISSKNEVFKTSQLDAMFFSRVKAFVDICRKTEGRRQRVEQLAALRAPLRFSSEELRGGPHRRTPSSRGSSQMPNARDTAKNFISLTRRPQNVKSGSPAVRRGSVNAVRIPFELFLVPPPFRHREEALNRVYAKERLEDADDTESLISEQSWFHK